MTMRRPGSKSLLKRVVEKVLPNVTVRRKSPEHPSMNVSKSTDHKRRDAASQGIRTTYHLPYTITPENKPEPASGFNERQSYHSSIRRRTSQHSCRADKLSIRTQDSTIDESPTNGGGRTKRLNLDDFIRRIENWTPPSPKEALARRLFREVHQAASAHPQTTPNRSLTGGYLVHRRIRSDSAP